MLQIDSGVPNSTSHSAQMTLSGISFTLNATPAPPNPSLVSWPIVPLTCVPCPSKSSGVLVLWMKSCGATIRPGVTSWVAAEYGIIAF